jgi:hypothetical protein
MLILFLVVSLATAIGLGVAAMTMPKDPVRVREAVPRRLKQ